MKFMNICQIRIDKIKNVIKSFLFILITLSTELLSQNIDDPKYTSDIKNNVIPGVNYEAGWMHKLFFGKHWRELWTLPVEVEILELDKFGGGLVPLKKGGGLQTKTLRFKDKDGLVWKFRSLDKDPAKVLPKDLQNTVVADIVQDQISSSNPFASLIVASILKSAGVLQSIPKLVILPDDSKLGEFQKEFGGLLGTIELNPDENDENEVLNFEGAEKVVGTFKLMHRLEDKRSEKVNSTEFLKARLLDIFLGDWDRHVEQWRWGRFKKNNIETWYPIPRDRDQAFSKFDGIGPSLAEYYIPQLNNFGNEYPPIQDITWSGRYLDRRYLVEITKPEWDSVTTYVLSKVTDDVIRSAVNKLPDEQFKIAGQEIISKLLSRRNLLTDISEKYYEMIQQTVDIWGSNKDDFVEIKLLDDQHTLITLYKMDKKTGEKNGKVFFTRTFENTMTDEIRVYMLDGDDKVTVSGEVDISPTIRLITGDGKDEVVNYSKNKIFVYDSGKKSIFNKNNRTKVDDSKYSEPKTDTEKYEPAVNDRGSRLKFFPFIQFDSDNGLTFGGSEVLTSYGFRVEPFSYKMTFFASYSTDPKSTNIYYNGIFNSLIKNTNLQLFLQSTELKFSRYYGFGNETIYNSDLDETNFYMVEQKRYEINPSIQFRLFKNNSTGIGLSYSYQNTSLVNNSLLNNFIFGNYGLGKFSLFKIDLNFEIDSRDNPDNTYTGSYFRLDGSVYPELFDNVESFYKLNFDIRHFFTTDLISKTTLALRTGGGKVWNKYPFFEAEFLGGSENLRGYRRERFSGDASLFGQAEIRTYLGKWSLIIPGKFGFHTFIETGRVFVEGDNSEKWHPSYGGGIWLSFIERTANLSLTIARSSESVTAIFKFALGF